MNNFELNKIADHLINGKYIFETEEYSKAINHLTNIEILPNAINILEDLVKSNNLANIFAASFILENTSTNFLKKNREKIYLIIKLISEKKYFRANFYVIEVLLKILETKEDYILYLKFINSNNEIEHNQAISQLLFLSEQNLLKFNSISESISEKDKFSIFFNIPIDINKQWFLNITKYKSLIYKKIVLIAVYRKFPYKEFVAELTDNNPDLFDFVFFLPNTYHL